MYKRRKSMSITNLIKGIETQYAQQKEEIIRLNKCLDARYDELTKERQKSEKLRSELYVLNRNLRTLLSVIDTERRSKDLTKEHKKQVLDKLRDIGYRARQRALEVYNNTRE
jgi:DNA repair ATPase RecN